MSFSLRCFKLIDNDPAGPKHVADWLKKILSVSLGASYVIVGFHFCDVIKKYALIFKL